MARNLTTPKEAAESLPVNEQAYRLVVEKAEDPIFVVQDSVIAFHNPKTEEITGYACEQLSFMPLLHLVHPEDRNRVLEKHKTAPPTKEAQGPYSFRILTQGGVEVWLQTNPVNITWKGKPATLHLARDITGQRQLEGDLLRSQKIEALGTLVGGLAHDFNNLLFTITGNISMAKDSAKPDDDIMQFLGEAEEASRCASDLTRRLMTFAETRSPSGEVSFLPTLIEDAVQSVLRGSKTDCRYEMANDLWPVAADEASIRYVFTTLIANSVEAMPLGGSSYLRARNIEVNGRSEYRRLPLKAGPYVEISVRDEGGGIPEESLSRIFDPYFSTRPMGIQKGVGLGLAIAYRLVQGHDGYMTAESETGIGSIFHVYLPASERTVQEEVPVKSEMAHQKSEGKRVLLMDDEEMLRFLAREMLTRLGYAAELAKNGDEAVALYKSAKDAGEPFDAVVLDMTVPSGMGGQEAVMTLRDMDPEVKAVACTGHLEDPVMSSPREYGFSAVLAKPFLKKDLSETLENLLMDAAA